MHIRKHWEVLVVDDEQDVIAVTKLALKNISVYGVPLKIHGANSQKAAVQLFEDPSLNNVNNRSRFAIALLDVVMETDHAGLDFAAYLREEKHNDTVQIFIRSGQPGQAPERAVTDRYDINAYLSKVDATEDRLYSVVKNGIRQFLWASLHRGMFAWSARLVAAAKSRDSLVAEMRTGMLRPCIGHQGKPLEDIEGHIAVFVDDQVIGIGDLASADRATALRKELASVEHKTVSETGDTFGRQGENVILKLAKEPGLPAVEAVARSNYDPMPSFVTESWVQTLRIFRQLWVFTK